MLNGSESLEKKVEIEKREKKLYIPEFETFYSAQQDEVVSFPEMVKEIYEKSEDLIFSLAGQKGETLDSLNRKTLGQIVSFKKRLDVRH